MKISVVISTLNRPPVLHDTIVSITRQELKPHQILISHTGVEHILPETLALPGVETVLSPMGSCVQRNRGLDAVAPGTDLVVFLDDDIELCASYFAEMARLFTSHPEIKIANGRMLHDGGRGKRISREGAITLCRRYDDVHIRNAPLSYKPVGSGYGCNMACRYSSIAGFRFDERMPLYGFLEDRDFSHRATLGGHPPVDLKNAVAVHLGWRSGRVSGVRLGFATIVNPIYLKRKANTFSFAFIFVQYWMRCLVGNVLGLITCDKEYDRAGLLKGNFMGWHHLLSGKCDPEHILHL
ncbi:MAG TPA: glycosyltransferase [Bryobacteraceae bacterium]|jgi:GT2 family glycosyltransferase|nr:glycosyltransferase [Bryobacteraceae bacterium]